jgi:nucleoside-diphosphate-sugar epimerase
MSHRVILTGATGMVGKSVLLECLDSPFIEQVLVVNRRPIGISHPKLRELLLDDLSRVSELRDDIKGYDACFFGMGVSAAGMAEAEYTRLSYDIPKAWVETLHALDPRMTFIYVSGMGTDETEKGRIMWARVKGRTENLVLGKGFAHAYAIRLGALLPERGIRSSTPLYRFLYAIMRPFFPLMRRSKHVITTTAFGRGIINLIRVPQRDGRLTNADLNRLAGA